MSHSTKRIWFSPHAVAIGKADEEILKEKKVKFTMSIQRILQFGNISSSTKPLLEQFMGSNGPASPYAKAQLLDKIHSSFREDEIALEHFAAALREDANPAGLGIPSRNAMEKSAELWLSSKLCAAYVVLYHDDQLRGSIAIHYLINIDASRYPESLKSFAIYLFIMIARTMEDPDVSIQALEAARKLDGDRKYETDIQGLRILLQARSALDADQSSRCVGLCQELLRRVETDKQLRTLALELMADAFQALGDRQSEVETLESWLQMFIHMPNGPAEEAAEARRSHDFRGFRGPDRSENLLQHLSRLCFLYEDKMETRKQAKPLYLKFINMEFYNWLDRRTPECGTITERFESLENLERQSTPPSRNSKTLVLLGINRQFGRIQDEDIEKLIKELDSFPDGISRGILVRQVPLRESQCVFDSKLPDAIKQLQDSLETICRIDAGRPIILSVKEVSVQNSGTLSDWLLLVPGPNDCRPPLFFGIEASVVGDRLGIRIHLLLIPNFCGQEIKKVDLATALKTNPENWSGANSLTREILNLVKRAIRRISERISISEETQYEENDLREI